MLPDGLDALARAFVPGRGDVTVERVSSGRVNDTYRVARDGRSFSLRLNAGRASDPGLDRLWECRVLRCASDAGVAPPLVRCDPAAGIVLTDWMHGRGWTQAESRQSGCIDALTRLLRAVHGLAVPAQPRIVTPAEWIGRYDDVAPLGGALRAEAHARLAWLSATAPVPPVLCHGDLHRLNVVSGRTALLLDWEYAHVSEPFWDLAGWAANEDWEDAPLRELLASYLQRMPTEAQLKRLAHLVWLYDYVCLSWSRLYLPGGAPARATALTARAALLERRLARRG